MAQRSRKRNIRYGGRPCGTLNGVIQSIPAYIGVHSCDDETHPGPPYRTGGPLLVSKKQVFINELHPYSAHYRPVPNQDWSGSLYVLPYIPSVPPTATPLAGWGAKGWNRAYPLHPIYSLGVSIAELRDMPRLIQQTRRALSYASGITLPSVPRNAREFANFVKNIPKNAAGEYLGYQFGVVPALQDLSFILTMKEKLEKKIRWLKRVNGKSIRRKFEMDRSTFNESIARTVVPQATVGPTLPSQLYFGSVVTSYPFPIVRSVDSRIWFSSKWRVWMPELLDLKSDQYPLKAWLSGLAADPSIIYKATAWTWLVDWFSSVGAVIQNISFHYKSGVVAEYAYVMCSDTFTYTSPGYVDVNVGTRDVATGIWSEGQKRMGGTSRTIYTFRQREVANPYGFGITFASLSLYQWSILAALGLSRGGKHLAPRT